MAITKIHAVKVRLGDAINYIENPDKTDGQELISGYNTVQAFNLLLSQASGTLATANLPLNLQPRAKAQAHGRLVAPRNVQVAVFGVVNACLGEIVIPGR